MGKLARKYVESIEECKYIERGTTCGVCGKKLGYFYEGFWSNNSKNRHLIDGVLCGKCHEHFNILIKDTKWASEELRKQPQWKKFTSLISESYTAEDIKWFFEQKEASDKEKCVAGERIGYQKRENDHGEKELDFLSIIGNQREGGVWCGKC